MADHNITLYISEMSPPARCVAYFLKYHKIESVKIQMVDFSKDEQKSPEFLKLNPQGTVPVLRDETIDITLWESTSMLEYLADLFKVTGVWGISDKAGPKYKTINALHNAHNFGVRANWDIMSVWYGTVFGGQKLDLDVLAKAIQGQKETRLKLLEEMLGTSGGFIAGSEPTAADFRVWTDLFQLSNLGGDVTLALVDFTEFPNISKYLQRGIDDIFTPQRDFWDMVLPYHQWAESLIGSKDYRLAEKKD